MDFNKLFDEIDVYMGNQCANAHTAGSLGDKTETYCRQAFGVWTDELAKYVRDKADALSDAMWRR